MNFRDLGGVPAAEGHVARGRLFRTGHLSQIEDADAAHLAEVLGIRLYLDFRAEFETARDGAPQPLIARGARWACHPFDISDATFRSAPRPRIADWQGMYLRAFERLTPELSGAIRLIASAEGPVVFGCWAGKDRTGMVAALLLALLGVDDETIALDYARTTEGLLPYRQRFAFIWQSEPEAEEELLAAHTVAHPEIIVGFLRTLRARFGSVRAALDLPEDVIVALKTRYLVADGASPAP